MIANAIAVWWWSYHHPDLGSSSTDKAPQGQTLSIGYRAQQGAQGLEWGPKWCFQVGNRDCNQAQPPSTNGQVERREGTGGIGSAAQSCQSWLSDSCPSSGRGLPVGYPNTLGSATISGITRALSGRSPTGSTCSMFSCSGRRRLCHHDYSTSAGVERHDCAGRIPPSPKLC
jgi:hypothetical protein